MARILVVDDEKDILKLVQKFLFAVGHDVVVADNVLDAMDSLERSIPDLLILDVNMPRTNGYQMANTLRNTIKFEKLPIVFLTARNEKKDIERAVKIGITDYIIKPIARDTFVPKIQKILEKIPQQKTLSFSGDASVLPPKMVSVKVKIEIQSVTEHGVHVFADRQLSDEETLVDMEDSFFETLGVKPLKLSIASVLKVDNGFKYFLQFFGGDKDFHAKVRAWILRHTKDANQKPAA